ncbi:unnamed protein product, partial [Pylaiella littoralis]
RRGPFCRWPLQDSVSYRCETGRRRAKNIYPTRSPRSSGKCQDLRNAQGHLGAVEGWRFNECPQDSTTCSAVLGSTGSAVSMLEWLHLGRRAYLLEGISAVSSGCAF